MNLLYLFAIPLIAAIITYFLPYKRLAFSLSLIPLILLIAGNTNWIGQQVQVDWLPLIGVQFYLNVDHLSLAFLYLTAIIIPIAIYASNAFFSLILISQAFLIGFFTARDLILFTIFWEAILIPIYLIIAYWGTKNPMQTTMRFLIYMIAGSSLLIVAILILYQGGGHTFNMDTLKGTAELHRYATLLFFIFAIAFAVKAPLFPFHAWLPDTYTYSPLAGTILLSAILSKAAIYGFLRIGVGLFPHHMQTWGWLFLLFAIVGVLYGILAAWSQVDYKRMIAYISLSHINFILVAVLIWSDVAHLGGIVQSINHGITIAALFLVAGWLEERIDTTQIDQSSGLAAIFPKLCWLTLFFVLSSVALPGLNNFIGELFILFALFQKQPYLTALVGTQVILSVIVMLGWMQKMYFNAPKAQLASSKDIGLKELVVAVPLVALTFWIGLYPAPLIKNIEPSTQKTFEVSK